MKRLFSSFLFLFGLMVYLVLLGNRSGSPTGRTGAPGETTCGTSGCHNTTPNTGSATINLTLNEAQTAYQLGETHKIAIAIAGAQAAERNGFEIVALDAQDNTIGQWILTGNDKQERSGSGRNYITQTTDGSAQTTWEIDWKAPEIDAGAITFYLAVVDANNNGGRTGDDVYTSSLSVEAEIASTLKNINSLERSKIYPNPVGQHLNLELDLSTPTYLTGTIRNGIGQSIIQLFQGDIVAGTIVKSIALPQNLTKGYYFLELRNSDGGIKSIPFVKK